MAEAYHIAALDIVSQRNTEAAVAV
jgi:hypothetical protein